MIVVETPLKTIRREMEALESQAVGGATRMYVLGAMAALRWIADGSIPASSLYDVISRPEVKH
jgi:hypothetical protein